MTPEQFDALTAMFATFDRRLANIEKDIADVASLTEAQAETAIETSKAVGKLQELYVALDSKVDDNATMVRNYVDATRDLRSSTAKLHSEVREKLKVG